MGISYRIAGDIVRTTVEGSPTADDIRAYLAAVGGDPRYRPGMCSLIDCRSVASVLSTEDLRSIAETVGRATPPSVRRRTAILARTDAVFGVIRMYEVFAETNAFEVQAFRNEGEAIAWLRRP